MSHDHDAALDQSLANVMHSDPFTAQHLMARRIEPLRTVVEGLLIEGLTFFVAKSKLGKSWTVLTLCVEIASGGLALGYFPAIKAHVLYLALEDSPRRLQDRLELILDGRDAPEGIFLKTDWERFDSVGLARLDDWLSLNTVGAVFIDTYAKVCPPAKAGQNVYLSDYAQLSALKKLADKHHVALVLVHHMNKQRETEDIFDRINGSAAMQGAADTMIILDGPRRVKADAILHVRGRDIDE